MIEILIQMMALHSKNDNWVRKMKQEEGASANTKIICCDKLKSLWLRCYLGDMPSGRDFDDVNRIEAAVEDQGIHGKAEIIQASPLSSRRHTCGFFSSKLSRILCCYNKRVAPYSS